MNSREADSELIAATAVNFALTGRGPDIQQFHEQTSELGLTASDGVLARAIEIVRQRVLIFAATGDEVPEMIDRIEAEAESLVKSLADG